MRTSRRDLIRLGAAAAVSCFVPGRASAGPSSRTVTPLKAARKAFLSEDPLLTRTLFSGQIDTAFRVEATSGSASRPPVLRLAGVADLPAAETIGAVGSDLCFAALFTGPKSAPLAQRTYRLHHAALGAFSVFLVPVGRPGK
jgi:hypothetical protein